MQLRWRIAFWKKNEGKIWLSSTWLRLFYNCITITFPSLLQIPQQLLFTTWRPWCSIMMRSDEERDEMMRFYSWSSYGTMCNVRTVHYCHLHIWPRSGIRYPVSGIRYPVSCIRKRFQIPDSRFQIPDSRSQIDTMRTYADVCGRMRTYADEPTTHIDNCWTTPSIEYKGGTIMHPIRSILKYIGKIRARHLPQWCSFLWYNMMMYPLKHFYSGNRREKETLRRFSEP